MVDTNRQKDGNSTFEQFDENHDFDQIDGNYTLENYMEKEALLSETTFGSNWLTFSWYVFMVPSLWYDVRESADSGGTIL